MFNIRIHFINLFNVKIREGIMPGKKKVASLLAVLLLLVPYSIQASKFYLKIGGCVVFGGNLGDYFE